MIELNEEERIAICKGIKAFRKNNNLTQDDMAVALQTNRATISMVEIGQQLPSFTMIYLIIKNFNVSFEELINLEK